MDVKTNGVDTKNRTDRGATSIRMEGQHFGVHGDNYLASRRTGRGERDCCRFSSSSGYRLDDVDS